MNRALRMTFIRTDGLQAVLSAVPGQSITVGRDLACELRLDGRKVSRKHFRIDFRTDGAVVLVDAGSHNGTYVNAARVGEVPLTKGDLVSAGEWEARVDFVETFAIPAQPPVQPPQAAPGPGQRPPTAPHMMPAFGATGATSGVASAASSPFSSPGSPPFSAAATAPPQVGGGPAPARHASGPQPLVARFSADHEAHAFAGEFEGPTDPSVRALGPKAAATPFTSQGLPTPASFAQQQGAPPPMGEAPRSGPWSAAPTGDTKIIDMRSVWKWDDNDAKSERSAESLRAARVEENPLVKRLTETGANLDFRGLSDLPQLDKMGRQFQPGQPQNLDALALRLVFKVTESLQMADSMDAFLADMADSLLGAARAKAVVVLLPSADGSSLEPRVVKNRRAEEKVQLSRTVIQHALRNRAAIATEDASSDERFARGESVLRFDLKAVLCAPLVKGNDVIGALYLTRDLPFSNTERDLVAALGQLIAMGLERSKLKEQILLAERTRRALERFHAPDVVRRLMMESNAPASARGDGLFLEPLTATVIFCDLSGFTTFCEAHDAEVVGRVLNAYLGTMTEIVFAHRGTVDKYIGDAIMCIFGAPFMAEDDALRAVQCAVEMRRAFRELVKSGNLIEPGPASSPTLEVHIGVNTGKVVAGTVGSPLRMEYTALGDTVNTAARLEGVAKAGQILIGPMTAELVRDHIPLVALGSVPLKGKASSLQVFEVPDIATPLPIPGIPGLTV